MTKIKDSLLDAYRMAGPEDRFTIMMENYNCFPGLICMAKKKLRYKLQAEREFLRSHNRGELGVRVQTSALGDPTADEAILEATLDEAFVTGEIDRHLLTGIEDASLYETDIRLINIMITDYELLVDVVNSLNNNDFKIMKQFLVEKKLIKDIAEDEDRSYVAIKKRIARIRADIKEEILECLEMSCRRCLV